MFPIINVLVFIVKDYCNSLVSFDYLKAAIFDFLLLLDNVEMTLPNVVNERLMFFSYSKC
jgi:hypothetical protein